jgi:P27 family predicted phage terminase small subunit
MLKLRGSWRGKTGGVEVTIPRKRPSRPARLTGEAKNLWNRLSPKLCDLGLLTELDRETFALLCEAWQDYVELRDQIKEPLIKTMSGNTIQNPLIGMMNKTHKRFVDMSARFALTPRDRAALGINIVPREKSEEKIHPFFRGT